MLCTSSDDIPRFRKEMADEIMAMRLRSEETEHLINRRRQPVSAITPKVLVESNEHLLDGNKRQSLKRKKMIFSSSSEDENCATDLPVETSPAREESCEAEALLTSEDELSENSKPTVNTATTTSASGGKEKRKGSANVSFH